MPPAGETGGALVVAVVLVACRERAPYDLSGAWLLVLDVHP